MRMIWSLAAAAAFGIFASPAGAIPQTSDDETKTEVRTTAIDPFEIEMVVKGWVLCASPEAAMGLVEAYDRGIDEAMRVYAELNTLKSCGQFPELRVILKSEVKRGINATAFKVLLHVETSWSPAYIVKDGLPTQ